MSTALLSLPAAKQQAKESFPRLAASWRAGLATPLSRSSTEIRLLDCLRICRDPDGSIHLFTRTDSEGWISRDDLPVQGAANWIMDLLRERPRALYAAEVRRLSGKAYAVSRVSGLHSLVDQALAGIYTQAYRGAPRVGLQELVDQAVDHLWTFLQHEVTVLGKLFYVTGFSFNAYNLLLAQLPIWQQLRRENEALVPLIWRMNQEGLLPVDYRTYQGLCQHVLAQGLPKCAWRTLFRFPAEYVNMICAADPDWRCLLRDAAYFAGLGRIPVMAHLSARRNALCYQIASIPDWFDRAAADEHLRRQAAGEPQPDAMFETEYRDALDWLAAAQATGCSPDRNQQKSGWPWIMRQSAAWHADQVQRTQPEWGDWLSLVGNHIDGPYEVVALTTSESLLAEGRTMHHCVGSYSGKCKQGGSRIFSIRQSGRPLATAELVSNGGAWRISQIRGPCNAAPAADLLAVGERLCERYNAMEGYSSSRPAA